MRCREIPRENLGAKVCRDVYQYYLPVCLSCRSVETIDVCTPIPTGGL